MNNNILEVNINNILNNLKYLQAQNPHKEICIPLKANAYGLGYEVVDYLIAAGYQFYAVSTLAEALYIRKKSKEVKILLFSAIFMEDLPLIIQHNITITVYDLPMLKSLPNKVRFHLKFDVGMGRLGFLPAQTPQIIELLQQNNLQPEGIYSHLPKSYDRQTTEPQIKEFENIVKQFSQFSLQFIHLYNGIGSLMYHTKFDNLIRPGLVTYGYLETKELKDKLGQQIKPAIKLKAKVSLDKQYSGNVGYDSLDKVQGEILTISLGYHDGLKQNYHGYEIPNVGKIVGKICMCQTMILKNSTCHLQKGEYITLIAEDNIYDLAKYAKISIYEILATLGTRIQRKYIKEEEYHD
ncbi:MAG: alanine racemase [Mycoplasmatales bacterium]